MKCAYCRAKNEDNAKSCVKCGVEILPIMDINSLQYEALSSSLASELKGQKVGIFAKSGLKKIVNSLNDGTCGVCKVRVEDSYEYDTSTADDHVSSYVTIYRMQTLEKNPISHNIESFYKFKPAKMSEVYILRIQVKKNYKYIVIGSNSPTYIIENIKDICYIDMARCQERVPKGIVDSISGVFSGLFSKK